MLAKNEREECDGRLKAFLNTLEAELNGRGNDEVQSFAVSRQVQRARKRAQIYNRSLRAQAIASWKQDDILASGAINLDSTDEANAREFILHALERFNTRMNPANIQVSFDWGLLYEHWRFGPGASNGVSGSHICDKIVQPFTCTADCVPVLVKLLGRNPYFSSYMKSTPPKIVQGSRLETVRKNQDTDRTIAIEPSGNMLCQLAGGYYLMAVLRCIGVNLSSQQLLNRVMARRGSVTGHLATLDLRGASNLTRIETVRRLWPPEWYDYMMACRSPFCEVDGQWMELHMLSTMGNGFTFPVMTLTLLALIYAVYARERSHRRNYVDFTEVAVYGDDIIVPSARSHEVIQILHDAGYVVNVDKSYCDGEFRESCGGDYYKGVDVTPFYVKTLRTPGEIYVAINQLLHWAAKTRVLPTNSLIYLASLIEGPLFLVPEWEQPNSGILTSRVESEYKLLKYKSVRCSRDASIFDVMLAAGGYLDSQPTWDSKDRTVRYTGTDVFYTPRPTEERPKKCKTRRKSLPAGWLDGWDPMLRSRLESDLVASWVWLAENLR